MIIDHMSKVFQRVAQVTLALSFLIAVSGCAERVKERQGQSINITPLTYTLSLNVDKTDISSAQNEIAHYIDSNFQVIESKGLNIEWYSAEGQKLSDFTKKYSQTLGLLPSRLTIKQTENIHLNSESVSSAPADFDITLSFTQFKVQTKVCSYEEVGKYGFNETNCYTDNARWQSMVNPEKMLPKNMTHQSTVSK